MTSQRENDLLTKVALGTAMGKLMRQYCLPALRTHRRWHPAASHVFE
jgi:hypothetical protein